MSNVEGFRGDAAPHEVHKSFRLDEVVDEKYLVSINFSNIIYATIAENGHFK